MSFADAEGVFYDPLAIHQLDPDSEDEERFVAVGMGSAGIILVCCLYASWRGNPAYVGSPPYAARGEKL